VNRNNFDLELEKELVSHMKTMEGMLFGFTPKRLRQLDISWQKQITYITDLTWIKRKQEKSGIVVSCHGTQT